jgi:transposase InsO family protein
MEAIPLSDTSAASCAKALTFTWISRIGVPETITSDHGPQFTSNLWFKLCEMLHISHRQTTAYHPESNGAVQRLHRCLKDALRDRVAAATWSEELPFVLPGLRAQPREDTGLSPAEAVFGAPIVLPNEFLQNEEMSVDAIITKFSKTLHAPAVFCPGTTLAPSCRTSCQATSSPPPSSGSVGAASSHPFSCSTTAPTQFCAAAPAPSPSGSGRGTRWSPSVALRPAWPRTPRLAVRVATADRRARALAVSLQPSGSRSQTHWSLHLLHLWRRHETVPEPFSYLARRFLHARDRRRLHRCHRRGTRPVNGHRQRG